MSHGSSLPDPATRPDKAPNSITSGAQTRMARATDQRSCPRDAKPVIDSLRCCRSSAELGLEAPCDGFGRARAPRQAIIEDRDEEQCQQGRQADAPDDDD